MRTSLKKIFKLENFQIQGIKGYFRRTGKNISEKILAN